MGATSSARNGAKVVNFDAGKMGRRLRSIPTTRVAINSQIRAYGKNVVARSRYLAANNPFASLAKEEFVAAFVGNGIKPSSLVTDAALKNEIQELFLEWTDETDADGLTDFYGQQGVLASEMFEAGECFVRVRQRYISDGLSVPLQIQLIPSEMCPLDHNMILGNGRRIECGIQFNAIGQREGYWFYRNHPGETLNTFAASASEKVFVPADQVFHLFKPIRAGQIRGIPHTLASIITLAIHDLYDDAELERKRTTALFGAFVTRKAGDDGDDGPFEGAPKSAHDSTGSGQSDYALEPGATVELEEGQDIKFAEPADVGGNYEAFQYRNLLRSAAGFGTPYANMTGDLRQANYGSQRGGLIAYRRRVEMMQNSVMIFQFCRPLWKRWLDQAVLTGALPINPGDYVAKPRDFQKVKWICPRWEWIDPLKDVSAEKLMVDAGFKARSDVIESMGEEPEQVDARIAADQDRAERLGLQFVQVSTGIVVSPSAEDQTKVDQTLIDPASNPDNTPGNQPPPRKAPQNGRRVKAKKAKRPAREIWDR